MNDCMVNLVLFHRCHVCRMCLLTVVESAPRTTVCDKGIHFKILLFNLIGLHFHICVFFPSCVFLRLLSLNRSAFPY